eukprot:233852_1
MRPTIDETELTQNMTTDNEKVQMIILPFGRFYVIWNCIILVILMYSLVETPYTLAFVHHHTSLRDIAVDITLITDLLFLVDIFISFRTGYVDKYDRLRIITDPRSIALHYLKTWFAIDAISCMPILVLLGVLCLYQNPSMYFEGGIALTLIRSFRLLKLFRISKLIKTLQIVQRKTFSNEIRKILRLVKIFGFMLLVAHYCACVWFYVGYVAFKDSTIRKTWIDALVDEQEQTFDEIPNFTKYTYSIYWAIVTLFTTGYGDIHACNVYEQWASLVCILIGSLFFAYFIGVLTTSMHESPINRYETEQIEEALTFCSHYDLPNQLREAVLAHIQYYCQYNFVFDEQRVMSALPNDLQKNVQNYLATSILCGLDIFKSLSQPIIGQIALKLKSKSVNTGHHLFVTGDCGKEMYIQRTGISKLKYAGSSHNYVELKRGDVCGQNAIISQKRTSTVQCETWSEFYVLDIADVQQVLQRNYPISTAKKKWNQIKHRVQNVRHGKPLVSEENRKKDKKTVCSTQKVKELFKKPSSEMRNNLILNRNTEHVMIGLPDYAGAVRSSIFSVTSVGSSNAFELNEMNSSNRDRKNVHKAFGRYSGSSDKRAPLLRDND